MCGIAGFLRSIAAPPEPGDERTARAMADALAHRGPDDQGIWFDTEAGIFLAHRRLAVLDLSAAGHQPMASHSDRYRIVFNGEIYNHLALRRDLPGVAWRGHSDTETLLACVDHWGVETALARSVGMFAFALWDREQRVLFLARDRLGEKPLYYGWQAGTLLFASELKAFEPHASFARAVDRDALALYLRRSYVPAPLSIFRGIRKLLPGTFVALRGDGRDAPATTYWSARTVVENGTRDPFEGTEQDASEELERLLKEVVASQMLSDVPLGAFLSGGVDSSTVVALMQAQSSRRVKTFTIGFDVAGYDEAASAKAVAERLGTDHTELRVTHADALDVVPRLPKLYDEPFADSSQIPTYLVSRLAKQHVTVSLSGDGGDEIFGGYNRYIWAPRVLQRAARFPRPLRAGFATALRAVSPSTWDSAFRISAPLLPRSWRHGQAGNKLYKLADVVAADAPDEAYLGLISQWQRPLEALRNAAEPPTVLDERSHASDIRGLEARMMFLDTISYLPDDILVKVDRAAMAVSLETRVPLLDQRVVEFAWRLPLSMKIRDGGGKRVLRRILERYVPAQLTDRPKAGFAVPLDEWLRGPLRDWAENLLDEPRLASEGYFEPKVIRRQWQDHQSGRRNAASALWNVLMFQAWLTELAQPKAA